QDANLRTAKSSSFSAQGWMFTKYDKFGRVVYTGFYPSADTRTTVQNYVNALSANPGNNEARTSASFSSDGMDIFYSQDAFPSAGIKVLTVNYYDTYPVYSFNPAFPATVMGKSIITDAQNAPISTKALPTMSLVKNIEDNNWTKSYVYYDDKARAVSSYSINHLGGYTRTESELDFAGVVKQTKTYHKRLDTDTEKVISQVFEYDPQNRVKKVWHQVNSQPQELLAENSYNELSQLAGKKVGNNLQSIEYTYDVRGALTKVNDPANLGTKLFGYELKYFNPENTGSSTGKYNGNIAEVTWKTATDGVKRRYNYQYDALNRLKNGIYSEPETSLPPSNFYNESVTYDMNSNILSLQRFTKGSAGTALRIDDLTYTYTGNRLNSVKDGSTNYSGYPDTSGAAMSYDANGNMKDHKDKGILQIDYNFLNLPKYIKFNEYIVTRGGGIYVNTTYTYRADGTKLRKEYNYKVGANFTLSKKTTDYLDGFQYETENNVLALKFVPTAEGYYDFEKNQYIYSYTDHLGNIRVSYFKNTNGSAEVLEENNFYPFGMKHEGYNQTTGNPAYSYQYNGKELQKETGWSDYGARMYMSDIARWGVIDPLAETSRRFTPYNYAYNNPIRFIDPDGRKAVAPEEFTSFVPTGGFMEYFANGGRGGKTVVKLFGPQDGLGAFYNTEASGGGGGNGKSDQNKKKKEGPNIVQRIGNFLSRLFSSKGAGIKTILPGASVSYSLQTGEMEGSFDRGSRLFGLIRNANLNANGESPLEQYRGWRDNPSYNAGESWLDRFARNVNSSHMEILKDEGSGGGLMYGGFGRGIAVAEETAGIESSIVNLTEETFTQALYNGAENVNGYSVYGTKGLVGNTFNRNIFLLEASGSKSLSGFRTLVGGMEAEAISAGATKISIYGSSVINKGFLNSGIAQRFGYSFEKIGTGVVLQKALK
ncbi:RHS repeat domain-containing protein, partial [Chryseobacterium sp. VD8]|uniref:RHS repeat domain-containing protein n=1 Tax=Chryseobacterium sp. VD8 TaxID=3081254 RepID=UPI0030175166